MRFLVATSASGAERLSAPLLGVPVALRAVQAATAAGATKIEVSGPEAARVLQFATDPRVTVPLVPFEPSREERVVVEGNAVVAPDLLRALRPGEALLSDTDQLVAARRVFEPGDKPSTPLRGLPIMDVPRTAKLYAVLIQDDGDFARARRALLTAQGHPADPPWTRALIRPVSARLAGILAAAGLRPTVASLAALVFAVISAWLLTLSSGAGGALAAVALLLTALFASMDGDLARLSLRESDFGASLDRVVSDSARILACVGALIGLARAAGAPWVHLVGASGVLFWFGVQLLRRDLGPVPPSVIRSLLHRDTVLAVVAVFSLVDFRWPLVVLWPLFAAGELALVLRSRRAAK